MDGKFNKHNVSIWGMENPQDQGGVAQNGENLTVQCVTSVNQVSEPYYFEGPVVTAASYKNLLSSYFLPMLPSLPSDTNLQHTRAPPRYSLKVCQLLDYKIPNLLIGRGGSSPWPFRSPYLTFLDIFMWICGR